MNEENLLVLARRGDNAAQTELVMRHGRRLFGLAAALLGGDDAVSHADDESNDGPSRILYSQAARGRCRVHCRCPSGRRGVKLWLDHRVPSPDADAGRLSRYMASPAFAALPDARKAPYLDAFQRASNRGELTPEQQRGVISNVTNPSGKNPIRQYFSLPGKEREKFLDDVIDRVLKADKESKLPPPPDKEGEKETDIDGEGLPDTIPPEDRARMGQFLQDLHDRRMARGLPDDGRFLFARPH